MDYLLILIKGIFVCAFFIIKCKSYEVFYYF